VLNDTLSFERVNGPVALSVMLFVRSLPIIVNDLVLVFPEAV
jgi:hypothetical protein